MVPGPADKVAASIVEDAHGLLDPYETQAFLVRAVDSMFKKEPGLREHFVDELLDELKEEIQRREDPRYAHATVNLIEEIEAEWRNRS